MDRNVTGFFFFRKTDAPMGALLFCVLLVVASGARIDYITTLGRIFFFFLLVCFGQLPRSLPRFADAL